MDSLADARHSSRDSIATIHPTKPPVHDNAEETIIDQMLAIVESQSDEGSSEPASTITRNDIVRIYQDVQGDPSRVYDDVMTLLAIRAMRLEEEAEELVRMNAQPRDAKLQWRELCHGLGLSECHEFFRILEALPDDERDAALSDNGGFFQSLLWKLEDDERAADELEKTMALVKLLQDEEEDIDHAEVEEHPLEILRRLFPDYKMHVIEDVYEAHGFDVEATAAALTNISAVNQVKSFASVIKATGPTTMWKKPVRSPSLYPTSGDDSRPAVESLGQFPVLPAKPRHGKLRNGRARPPPLEVPITVNQTPSQFAVERKNAELRRQRMETPNAWNTQATPLHGGGTLETKLTTDLKLERLQRLLPSIDRELIRTTFFLNHGSSTATEAALREIFHLPMPQPPPLTTQPLEDGELSPVTTADARVEDSETYAECRSRVDDCWHQLSDRYVAALRSFNRDHHIIANDRVRDIAVGRRALRDAQHAAAHAFVEAHATHIRRHQALDLHGLTVVEALRVAREVIEVCRAERIRRCILICGVGNHSINQKARLLTAIQLSLEHRHIAFRKESGVLYIYPLRASP